VKWMQIVAKFAVFLAIVLLGIIFRHIAMTSFTRIDDVQLIEYAGGVVFCSTESKVLYKKDQNLKIAITGTELVDITIVDVIDTGFLIGGEEVILYETDLDGIDNRTSAAIYTEYTSFVEYIIDKWADL